MEKKGLHYAMMTIRRMVDSFLTDYGHQRQWDAINEEYKNEHGFHKGSETLILQSYIGSDLLIDFVFLAKDVEEGKPFTNEYWIRSMGTQCVRTEEDKENNRVFTDILAKISVTYDGNEFTDIHWFQDEDCLIDNKFVKENKPYDYAY